MYAVSDRFLQACINPPTFVVVADLYYDNVSVPAMTDLPVVSGTIKVDRQSRTRRSGSLKIGDPSLYPTVINNSKLNVYGTEIVVRCGWQYADKTQELIPMGRFIINEIDASDAEGLFPSIEFFDRAHRVWEMSTHVADSGPQLFGGNRASTALRTTIVGAAPGWSSGTPFWDLTFEAGLNDVVIPGGAYDGDTDRWKMASELATSMGGEVFFQRDGNAVVRPIPILTPDTPVSAAVLTIEPGDSGALVDGRRQFKRDDTYNSVVVTGAQAKQGEKQPFAAVYDLDPRSKTYYNGPFGKKTLRVQNTGITSDTSALITATEKLKQVSGCGENVSVTMLRNPALDASDIILVRHPDGTQSLKMIESINFDFTKPDMTVETRTTQYV